MPTLTLTLNGANGRAHDWNHVLVPLNQVKTLLNTTLLDYLNVQSNGIRAAQIRAHAGVRLGRFKVRNATGGTLTAGTIIYESGVYDDGTDTYPSVSKAVSTQANGTTKYGLAVIEEDISNNADGTAVTHYEVTGLNTSAKAVGDRIFLSNAVGSYVDDLTDLPAADYRVQIVGKVTVSSATIGRILLCNWSIIPWSLSDQI